MASSKKLKYVEIKETGIAVDIDETLSWTIGYRVERMQELFGNPENLSVEELIKIPLLYSKSALLAVRGSPALDRKKGQLQRDAKGFAFD